MADWGVVDTWSEKRKARMDHGFTWKAEAVDLGEGELRIAARICGDEVSSFWTYVHLPESSRRSVSARMRAAGLFTTSAWGSLIGLTAVCDDAGDGIE